MSSSVQPTVCIVELWGIRKNGGLVMQCNVLAWCMSFINSDNIGDRGLNDFCFQSIYDVFYFTLSLSASGI